MTTVEQVLFAIGLLVCVALLVHQGLGERRQARLAIWWRGRSARARLAWAHLRLWLRQRRQRKPRSGQTSEHGIDPDEAKRRAVREAANLIERARRGNGKDGESGKVIRPPRFGDRRKDLH